MDVSKLRWFFLSLFFHDLVSGVKIVTTRCVFTGCWMGQHRL